MEPAELSQEIYERISAAVKKALDALEIQYGASHAEFKLDAQGKVHIIEIGARMGGDCIGSHLVELSTGRDYLKMVLDVALGQEPDITQRTEKGAAYIRFIFGPEDLKELEFLKKNYGDRIQYVSEMDLEEKHPVKDSSSRYGYYIMRFNNTDEARSILKL